MASGSVAQVYRAAYRGQPVAVKVRARTCACVGWRGWSLGALEDRKIHRGMMLCMGLYVVAAMRIWMGMGGGASGRCPLWMGRALSSRQVFGRGEGGGVDSIVGLRSRIGRLRCET